VARPANGVACSKVHFTNFHVTKHDEAYARKTNLEFPQSIIYAPSSEHHFSPMKLPLVWPTRSGVYSGFPDSQRELFYKINTRIVNDQAMVLYGLMNFWPNDKHRRREKHCKARKSSVIDQNHKERHGN
jgi:hypothetical protein